MPRKFATWVSGRIMPFILKLLIAIVMGASRGTSAGGIRWPLATPASLFSFSFCSILRKIKSVF
ncbi:hypothetical protein GGI35DRAFT_463287 [Trichoderma velutinum]